MANSKDMKRLFDPVVKEISNLIRQQVTEVRRKTDAVIDVILQIIDFHSD
jgi:hypothetical protein